MTARIQHVDAYMIYDSRGRPTVEGVVMLEDGSVGRGLVPSGASTGQFEALELRDGGERFDGKGVSKAVGHVQGEIARVLRGKLATDQRAIDQCLIDLDATPGKSRLGANAILAASLACCDAAAKHHRLSMFRYLAKAFGFRGSRIPVPEIQIMGGGAHAGWRTDVQDVLIIAVGATSIDHALEITHDVFHAAGRIMKQRVGLVGVADEGGYWPEVDRNEDAIAIVAEAIAAAGYQPGIDAAIALDMASSDLYDEQTHRYRFRMEDRDFSSQEFVELQRHWCERYPIVSIEDGCADTDWDGWSLLHQTLGERVQLVGDDLFTTNTHRIAQGIERGVANAVLIKLNQIGTVSETIDAIKMTQDAGWRPVVSARSGETEDAFISHLAVATDAGQLKVGSFSRSERMVKWNELLRIGRELGDEATWSAGLRD